MGREKSCRCFFLDIELPDINGLELAKKIKSVYGNANIIFVTGHPEYALDAHKVFASGFLVKPYTEEDVRCVLANLRFPVAPKDTHDIRIQCFGNFEVFYKGVPVKFRRNKSKELLAYLVMRKGALCSHGEILQVLWEELPDSASLHAGLRNLIFDLSHTFEEFGVDNLLERQRGALAVNTDILDCDYYKYLRGDLIYGHLYRGEFMYQYSWAEETAANLQFKK